MPTSRTNLPAGVVAQMIDVLSSDPMISIGLPVYNEIEYIQETLQHIRSQSYEDFEIIISDNASDDGTFEFLQQAAVEDSRIKLTRQNVNLGAIANGRTVINSASGDYFILASGHDLWQEDLLEQLLQGLEQSPKSVLAYPNFERIDMEGNTIPWRREQDHRDTSEIGDPVRRFNLYLWCGQWPIYGLIRMETMKRTRGIRNLVAPGIVLLCELAILGRFLHVPGATTLARQNRPPEMGGERRERYATMAAGRRQRFLPYWRIPLSLFISTIRTPIHRKRRWETRIFLVLSSLNAMAKFHRYLVQDLRNLLPW